MQNNTGLVFSPEIIELDDDGKNDESFSLPQFTIHIQPIPIGYCNE